MPEEKKGGGRGHPVKGKNIAGQYKALAAKGILSGGQKGKKGSAKYNPGRSGQLRRFEKAAKSGSGGSATFRSKGRVQQKGGARRAFATHNHSTNAAKSSPYGNGRFVIGGKTAGLRGGTGSGVGSERAQRIAQARRQTERGVLPGGWREGRKHEAQRARGKLSWARDRERDAARYKAQGNTRGFEAQTGHAAKAREEARQIVSQAKRELPRVSVERARSLSREAKAQNMAERKAKSAAKRAQKTLEAVRQSQKHTYNGWSTDPQAQKRRYARLKGLERAIKEKYRVW